MIQSLIDATPKWNNEDCFVGMNPRITKWIRKRNKVRKSFQKSGCVHCKKVCNILCNRIEYELGKFKNKLYDRHLQDLNIRNGTLWNAMKINKLASGHKNINKNEIHGPNGISYDKLDIANIFADHFEIVHELTKDFGYPKHNNIIKKSYSEIIDYKNCSDVTTAISSSK